ncbi:MAG: YitT family protein [Lachnospiraceae bacterium]
MSNTVRGKIVNVIMVSIGCIAFAAGIALFLDPNRLAPGGTAGIAIIINHITTVQIGTIILIINIPILIFGWWKFGTKFMILTVYATVLSSTMMNGMSTIMKNRPLITDDPFLAGVAGGTLMALGMGIIFRNGATAGGSDVLVKALRQKFPHIKTGTIYIISDFMIILTSALIFKDIETALYAGITVVVSNFVLDAVLYGSDGAKLLYIISDKSNVIQKRIVAELGIGLTNLRAEGGYSEEDRDVLMCVTRKLNYSKIRQIVREEDEAAFLIVSGASEVFGYGYKDHFMEEI